MTMAATVVALTMNAQGMYVGGSLGFNTKSHDGNTLNSSFSIIPEFGVNFNEKMAVGMEIGYSHDNDKTNKSGNTGYELKTNTFKVAPYFRYTAVRMGNLGLFADGKFSYSTSTNKRDYVQSSSSNTKYTTNTFGVYIQPGVSYSLNDNFSLVAKFGNIFGFTSSKPDIDGAKATKTIDVLKLSNNISFGFYYNF